MSRTGPAQRIALVTGASSGIGKAVTEDLAAQGFTVLGVARRLAPLEKAPCRPYALDVRDAAAVGRLATEITTQFGRLDALINCAGIVRSGRFETAVRADMTELVDVNLWGVINVTQAFIPLLKSSRGNIVSVSSTLSQRPTPGVAIYAATKGAIEALTRALAIELAPDGVRVNAVQPALVRSEIWTSAGMDRAAYDTLLATRGREYPLGRVGEPKDVAAIVSFLVSDQAAWITGACLPVDGGSSLGSVRR